MKLSIIIPELNEGKTIEQVIHKLLKLDLKELEEIIVVDDGSTDDSLKKVGNIKSPLIKMFSHKSSLGKGMAVRTGMEHSRGDYILIQDADLEYDPLYIPALIKALGKNQKKVIYGSRLNRFTNFMKDERNRHPLFMLHYFGNRFLSLITSLLYGSWLTDMETGYKLFPKKAIENMKLYSKSFDFEAEITAKLLKKGFGIYEVPISTTPRNYSEGKKLRTFHDGVIALWTLIKYRFID